MEDKKEPTLLTEVFDRLYSQMDPWAEKTAKRAGTTCRKGCSHCCYLLAAVTQAEAMNIADHLLRDREYLQKLPDFLDELRTAALAADVKDISRAGYFEKKIKCPFLNKAEGICNIYSIRPSPCRYHYVISAPELCSPDAPKDVQTASLDFIHLEAEIWKVDEEVSKDSPIPIVAPLSIVVLWALKTLVDASDTSSEVGQAIKSAVHGAVKGVPTPIKWTMDNYKTLLSETGYIRRESIPLSSPKP